MAPAWKRAKSLGQKSHTEREELCRLNEWIMRLQLMSRFTSSTQQEAGHKNKVSLLEPALYSLQMGELSQGSLPGHKVHDPTHIWQKARILS